MSLYQIKNAELAEKIVKYLAGKRVEERDLLALFASKDVNELEAYMALPPHQQQGKQNLSATQYFEALDNLSEFLSTSKGHISAKNHEAIETLQFSAILYAKQTIPKNQRRMHPFRILALNRMIKAFDAKYSIQRGAGEDYRSIQNDLHERYQSSIKEELEARTQSAAFRAEENTAYLSTLSAKERAKEEALQRAEHAENEALDKMFVSAKQLLARHNALAELKAQVGFLQPSDEKQLQALETQSKAAQAKLQQKVAEFTIRTQLMRQLGQITPERCQARIAQLQSGDFSYSLYNSEEARRAAGQLSGHELNEVTLSRLKGKAHEAFLSEMNSLKKDQHERTGSFFALPSEKLAELQADMEKLSPDAAQLALTQVEQHGVDLNNRGLSCFLPLTAEAHAAYRAKANAAYLATLSPAARREEELLQKKEQKENQELESMYRSIMNLRADEMHTSSSRRFTYYQKREKAMQEKLERRVAQLLTRTQLEYELGHISPERYAARMEQLKSGDLSYSIYNTKEARLAADQYSMRETVTRIAPPPSQENLRLTNALSLDWRNSAFTLHGPNNIDSLLSDIQKLPPELKQAALATVQKKGVNLEAQGMARILNLSKKQLQDYTARYNKLLTENYPGIYSQTTMMLTPEAVMRDLENGKLPLALCSEDEVKQHFDAGISTLKNRIENAVKSALKSPTKDAPLFMTEAQQADFFATEINVMMERFFKTPNLPEGTIDMSALLLTEDDYEFREVLFAKTPIMNYIGIRYQDGSVTENEKDAFRKQYETQIKAAIAKVDLSAYITPLKPERVQANMYGAFLRSYKLADQTKKFEAIMQAHNAAELLRDEARAARAAGETLTEAQSKALTEPTPLEAYVQKAAKTYFAQNAAENRALIQARTKEYVASKFSRKPMTREQFAKSLLSLKKDTMQNMAFLSDDLPRFMENEESVLAYIDEYDLLIEENREAFRNQIEYEKKRKALDAAENEARGTDGMSAEDAAQFRATYEKAKAEFTAYQTAYQADPKNKINTASTTYRNIAAMEAVASLQQQKKQVDLSSRLHAPTTQVTAKPVIPQAPVSEKQIHAQLEER